MSVALILRHSGNKWSLDSHKRASAMLDSSCCWWWDAQSKAIGILKAMLFIDSFRGESDIHPPVVSKTYTALDWYGKHNITIFQCISWLMFVLYTSVYCIIKTHRQTALCSDLHADAFTIATCLTVQGVKDAVWNFQLAAWNVQSFYVSYLELHKVPKLFLLLILYVLFCTGTEAFA